MSTVGCTPGVVRVYDSLRMGLTSSLKKAIADMLHTSEKQVVFEHMNMQWQSSSDDCGLFVMATAILPYVKDKIQCSTYMTSSVCEHTC